MAQASRTSRRDGRGALRPAPAFVLVEPQLGENIGAAARAMLNFGAAQLRLVAPRDGWPNPAAAATASGADVVIERAQVFGRLEEALADCNYVLATTARPREILLPVLSPEEAAAALKARIDAGARCAVMFGRERSGLLNDEVARADAIVSIPVNPSFASLNLAQAVAVLAYEWAKADGREGFASGLEEAVPATRAALEGLLDQLIGALDAAGYFFPPEKRPVMERNLRAAFTRAGFAEGEIRTLRGVVKALAGGPRKEC
ncbi:RNA methyltransferase [Amphiplicatus metriothermophilus]|uniref:tRNA (cytidine/uridine-2'-O-)-methyltransferase TrmJ n=1 Tax=Amphiplicatus metriothermophilus TaxID=1519374 RepID=A0A239PY14_9PROT|nr:RNA methyltransferase [Amphiplicatus metriothermophilus]MBB5520014.1 tRNA/rRNA methyltransferase [Amphiplicatus metriothermophilus]SNT74913.1 tRNA/rRNA methyltransferase [Amphiplicatus metriothermophilus]